MHKQCVPGRPFVREAIPLHAWQSFNKQHCQLFSNPIIQWQTNKGLDPLSKMAIYNQWIGLVDWAGGLTLQESLLCFLMRLAYIGYHINPQTAIFLHSLV